MKGSDQKFSESLTEEQFQEWIRRRSQPLLAFKGHGFVFVGDNVIGVDGGKFVYEGALELVKLLNSPSPLAQIKPNFMIAERNGALRIVVIVLAAIIIMVALFIALR